MKVIAIVGMTGSGKTELAGMMEKEGYHKIRFGDITEEKIKEAGLQVNEKNERYIREKLRKDHGMAAYAILNEPKITKALKKSDVVADGLYSWEEYLYLKEKFGNRLIVLAVYSPPSLRHKWLGKRPVRPLTPEEAQSRDKSEIENINKVGPIAIADYMIRNIGTMDELKKEYENFKRWLNEQKTDMG